MNIPKNLAVNSTRDKENTPAYQVRFGDSDAGKSV
jgi:hypothetical protein